MRVIESRKVIAVFYLYQKTLTLALDISELVWFEDGMMKDITELYSLILFYVNLTFIQGRISVQIISQSFQSVWI